MEKEKATNQIGIRITDTLKERINQRAAEEGRTPSNFVINIVTKYLDEVEKGYIDKFYYRNVFLSCIGNYFNSFRTIC